MNARQQRSFVRWASEIASVLVPGWDVRLHFADPGSTGDGSDAIASVECIWGRRKAAITVSPDIFSCVPEEQREVIVHELVHVIHYGVKALVTATVAPMIGQSAWTAFEPGLTKADEDSTDAMARAIAPLFPLWEGA